MADKKTGPREQALPGMCPFPVRCPCPASNPGEPTVANFLTNLLTLAVVAAFIAGAWIVPEVRFFLFFSMALFVAVGIFALIKKNGEGVWREILLSSLLLPILLS